jgi:hypothetical protein
LGSAEFFLLFSSGTKPPEVKFVSGSQELKDAGKFLSAVKLDVPFPDNGPELLLRRGMLTCDPYIKCSLVLYQPQSVRSVN